MIRRAVRTAASLAKWYATPTGLLYLTLAATAIVLTFAVAPEWGMLPLVALVVVATPQKLAHLELQRLAAGRSSKAMSKAVDKQSRLARSTAHAARRDAIAAIDTARHEWKNLLRAERRLTDSTIRTALNEVRGPMRSAQESLVAIEAAIEELGQRRALVEAGIRQDGTDEQIGTSSPPDA